MKPILFLFLAVIVVTLAGGCCTQRPAFDKIVLPHGFKLPYDEPTDECVGAKFAAIQEILDKQYPDEKIEILMTPAICAWVIPGSPDAAARHIEMAIYNVPVLEAVRYYCALLALELSVEGRRIIIREKNEPVSGSRSQGSQAAKPDPSSTEDQVFMECVNCGIKLYFIGEYEHGIAAVRNAIKIPAVAKSPAGARGMKFLKSISLIVGGGLAEEDTPQYWAKQYRQCMTPDEFVNMLVKCDFKWLQRLPPLSSNERGPAPVRVIPDGITVTSVEAPTPVDRQEQVRNELVDSTIKLYFSGDERCAIDVLREVLKAPQNAQWPVDSLSRVRARKFLNSLSCDGMACQLQEQKLAECRKRLSPQEFLDYLESTLYRWW